jgi:hypothetical protein
VSAGSGTGDGVWLLTLFFTYIYPGISDPISCKSSFAEKAKKMVESVLEWHSAQLR